MESRGLSIALGLTVLTLVGTGCNKAASDTNDPPNITAINATPVLNAGQVAPLSQTSLTLAFLDSEDELTRPQDFTFAWSVEALPGTPPPADLASSVLVPDDNPTIWRAPATEGVFRLTGQVCDKYGACASESLTIVVDRDAAVNTAPRITSAMADTLSPTIGQPVTLTVLAEDSDGDPLQFDWTRTAGSFQSINGGTAVWIGSSTGSATVTVTVRDGRGGTDSEEFRLTVG